MIRILPYILLGLLFYIVLFYMEDYQPEIMNDVLIKVDVLGLTNVAKEEQDRIYAINSLGIDVTHPEKASSDQSHHIYGRYSRNGRARTGWSQNTKMEYIKNQIILYLLSSQ